MPSLCKQAARPSEPFPPSSALLAISAAICARSISSSAILEPISPRILHHQHHLLPKRANADILLIRISAHGLLSKFIRQQPARCEVKTPCAYSTG
ncbi:CRISPR-associated protein Cas5 [Reticulibacter mediterranei]|uniref:CRISPR-associated protein Cas5 n=1 Tax=Reticulibacter mediterranei TaxID=2778369 RepID=UPI003570B694